MRQYTLNTQLQGVTWDDAAPQFDNYSYPYTVRNAPFAVEGNVVCDKVYWLIPSVIRRLGVEFNLTYDYTNIPLTFEELPNKNFTNHAKIKFT